MKRSLCWKLGIFLAASPSLSCSLCSLCSFTCHALPDVARSASVLHATPRQILKGAAAAAAVLGTRGGALPLSAVSRFYKTCPYSAAFLTCSLKGAAADLVAQKTGSDRPAGGLDRRRLLAFLLYGGLYQGMVQEYAYNNLFSAWFGRGTDWRSVFIKVGFNLAAWSPLVTLPAAYVIKAAVFRQTAGETLRAYMHDIRKEGLLTKFWMMWLPLHTLTFSVVPEHLRITWIAMWSFLWMILFSKIAARKGDPKDTS